MGVLDSDPAALNQWCLYGAEISFRGKVMGGVPKDPKIIESWLRSKAGITDTEELLQALRRTALEMGLEVRPGMTYQQLMDLTAKYAEKKQTQGFKRDAEGGLYIESRQLKAMLKEGTNVLFAGERWGVTKKGPKNYLTERVFVFPSQLFLGVHEPTGVDMMIGHHSGPQGPQSTLGYGEYVLNGRFDFTILALNDAISHEQWVKLWSFAQLNGLGAKRSASYGTFDLTRWDRLGPPSQDMFEEIMEADRQMLKDQPIPDAVAELQEMTTVATADLTQQLVDSAAR